MASYHLAVKTVSRSSGRSATAAVAYRAGVEIVDERTGLIHDYTRKQGVEHRELVLPDGAPEWAAERSALWNAAEQAETRKNSTVAREFEVALPDELTSEQRRDLTMSFAREISERHGVAVDVAIHAPGREGDHRNHHAHLLVTTRRLGPEGLGEKTRELDQKQSGEVDHWRQRWAEVQNRALERAGVQERVDHRSFKERGLDQVPLPELSRQQYQVERRAQQDAERTGKRYEPVTEAGKQREAVAEQRRLRQYIERGQEWLKQAGHRVGELGRTMVEAMNKQLGRDLAERERAERERQREAERVRQEREREIDRMIKARSRDRGMER